MRSLFLSPHSDDETLFGAYTIIEHQPSVVLCFPSASDYGDTVARRCESSSALTILAGGAATRPWQWYPDTVDELVWGMRDYDRQHQPEIVWAPSAETNHPEHDLVHTAATAVFTSRVRRYDTYRTRQQDTPHGARTLAEKVRTLPPVTAKPDWVLRKLQALACYQTQILHPRASQFFQWDLHEYAERP